jgi:ABC-type nitrate/sulfonate/bicarbonate transport system permease component
MVAFLCRLGGSDLVASLEQTVGMPLWTEPILQLVIATFPAMMFTACYFYLCARHTLQLNRRTAVFTIFIPTVSDVLLLIFLLQVPLYPNGWQWYPPIDSQLTARPSATILLVGGFSFLLHRIGRYFDKTADINGPTIVRQLRELNLASCLGAGILWVLCFALWDRLFVLLRDIFAIAPLSEVIRAAYRLLTTGPRIANMRERLWLDFAVSSQELAEGLLLTGIAGSLVVKVVQFAAASTFRSSWFFAATHTVPVVLAISFLPWMGVGHWFRAAIVAAVSFLPFVQSLWSLRDQRLVSRILLALDNALPYAFVGMLFAQLFASTAGLGFVIVVARAEGNRTEALATSLITFGLMITSSLVLRLAAKRVRTSSRTTI